MKGSIWEIRPYCKPNGHYEVRKRPLHLRLLFNDSDDREQQHWLHSNGTNDLLPWLQKYKFSIFSGKYSISISCFLNYLLLAKSTIHLSPLLRSLMFTVISCYFSKYENVFQNCWLYYCQPKMDIEIEYFLENYSIFTLETRAQVISSVLNSFKYGLKLQK